MRSLLTSPLPAAVLGAVAPQIEAPASAPTWVTTALFGVFVTLWFLAQIGRLPGASEERRSPQSLAMSDRDRSAINRAIKQLDKVHGLVATRSSEDGIERFLAHHQITREAHDVLRSLADNHAILQGLVEDHRTQTRAMLSTLQTIESSLRTVLSNQEAIKGRLDDVG